MLFGCQKVYCHITRLQNIKNKTFLNQNSGTITKKDFSYEFLKISGKIRKFLWKCIFYHIFFKDHTIRIFRILTFVCFSCFKINESMLLFLDFSVKSLTHTNISHLGNKWLTTLPLSMKMIPMLSIRPFP